MKNETNALQDSRKYNVAPVAKARTAKDKSFSMDTPAKTPPTYFETIILTLTDSLNDPDHLWISVHDLIEAYNVLSRKIRSLTSEISSADQLSSFFAIFQVKSTQITECLTRDIRRMLLETQRSYGNLSSYSQELDENELEVQIDHSVLCLEALRFISGIFIFPVIYSNFTEDQLTGILDDILSLCTIENPTAYNSSKLSEMALWILKTQELPLPILIHQKSRILLALKMSISADMGHVYAFKAVHRILEKFPSCSAWLVGLLPVILERLDGGSSESRVHAALALSGFGSAKVALGSEDEDQFPRKEAVRIVKAYLEKEAIQRRPVHNESRTITTLVTALTNGTYGPAFSLSVVSCFILLLEDAALTFGRSIRLITRVLALCERHELRSLRAMHTDIWIMLIWSYSHLPADSDDQSREGNDSREKAYSFLCNALSDRSRLAFIYTLLGTSHSSLDVRRAIDLVGKMVNGDITSSHEGVKVLCHLLSTIGSSHIMNPQPQPKISFARELVNGSYLFLLPAKIKVPEASAVIEQISPLTEEEVLQEWKTISSIWVRAVQQSLNCGHELSSDILQVWQALLLVHAELQAGQEHLSASPSFALEVTSILTDFAMPLATADQQRLYLMSIKKLWTVMKNVFSSKPWLSSPAEKILVFLLTKKFLLTDDQIKLIWSQLCGDLIIIGVSPLLHALHARNGNPDSNEVSRCLWVLVAEKGPSISRDIKWKDLVKHLAAPFGSWDLSPFEVELWRNVFHSAVDRAINSSHTSYDVVSYFLELLGDSKLPLLARSSTILNWLLAQSLSDPCAQAHFALLSLIDDRLISSYDASVEKRSWALDTLKLIGKLVRNTSEEMIVQLLSSLQEGLSCWLSDDVEFLDDQEYGELVQNIYNPALEILAQMEPTIATLEAIPTFLKSVFNRDGSEGPQSFLNFWNATFHERKDISPKDYPPAIKQIVKAWADVLNNSLGDGFHLHSGSDSLESYTIPDSQPLDSISVHESMTFDVAAPVDENIPVHVVVHDYSRASGSRRMITPSSSVYIQQDEAPEPQEPIAPTSKRSADDELPRTPKRTRINAKKTFKPRAGKAKATEHQSTPTSFQHSSGHSRHKSGAQSPTSSQLFFLVSPLLHDRHLGHQSSGGEEDDYDSWEQGVTVEDVRQLQGIPDNENIHTDEENDADTEPMSDADNSDMLSPSLGHYPPRSRRRERSQTAPEIDVFSQPETIPQPLRRNNTTPLERQG